MSRPQELQGSLLSIVLADPTGREILEHVEASGLCDAWVAAGVVRNAVWDALHDFHDPTPLNDVDIICFDQKEAPCSTSLHCQATRFALVHWEASGFLGIAVRSSI